MTQAGYQSYHPYVDRPAKGLIYAVLLAVAVFVAAAAWAWVAAPVLSWMASGV